MIFLAAALVGVLAGLLCGGRLSNLPSLHLRWLWLIPSALVVQLLIFPFVSERPILPFATVSLHVLSYVLLVAFLILNLRVRPLLAVGAGALFNLAAIALNAGHMPASATALARAGYTEAAERLLSEGSYGNVLLMSDSSRLNILGDWLYLPSWVPFSTAFSLGDVIIMLGIAWLIVRGMRARA
jgi:hypothetical protein